MRKAKVVIAVSLFALLVLTYARTSSLSVSWKNFSEDSGDLLTAAFTLGIPHPTGYPLYVLLGRIFSLVMPGGIAFRITLLSLFAASLAPVFLFLTLARLLPRAAGLAGAAAAALSLGLSLYFWSQAVVAEVYTFHVLFFSVVAYLIVRWSYPVGVPPGPGPDETSAIVTAGANAAIVTGPDRYFFLAAYLLGLSFANHMLSIVTLVFAAVLVLSGPGRKEIRPSLVVKAFVCFLIPLTLYAYLPIRSVKNPELDWGNPETWRQFRWVVTGEQYRFRFMAQPIAQAITKLWPGAFFAVGWPALFLSTVGLFSRRLGGALRRALVAVIVADFAVVVLYDIPDFAAYFLPASFAFCFLAGAGFERIVSASAAVLDRTGRDVLTRVAIVCLTAALLVGVVLPPALHNGYETDASTDLYPYVFGRATFRVVEPDALIISEYDGRTFALWFFGQTEFKKSHPDCVVVLKYLLVWPWYVDNLRRLHPDLSVPQAGPMDSVMLSLVASNIEKRPIYTVRDDPALKPFYRLRQILGGQVELFRVEKTKAAGMPAGSTSDNASGLRVERMVAR